MTAKDEGNDEYDDSVYGLVTKLSKHLLHINRSFHQNVRYAYEYDIKMVKRLRTKAFEILLKKDGRSVSSQEFEETDPFLELQKHVFTLKLGLRHTYDATMLENLLQELEEIPSVDVPVSPVLQLLIQLKSYNNNPEPITNVFYCDKINPALPEVVCNDNEIPPFQMYPMDCFVLSDKFEATLENQRFQISRTTPTNIMNDLNFLHDSIRSKALIGIESTDISITHDFMSNHIFDKTPSYMLCPNQNFITNPELNLCIPQSNFDNFSLKRGLGTNYLYLPLQQSNIEENESITDKFLDLSIIESCSITNIWDCIDVTNLSTLNRRTWEEFGEVQPVKESLFITDTSAAMIHLEKIQKISSLPLLSDKIMNSVVLLEEIPIKDLINDVKSMLLGVESNSFEYKYPTGFVLRKNVSIRSVCSESLKNVCKEAINWGNCFRYLSELVAPKTQSTKLPREGLIFKAMCTNIKELLLYYQAVLLRIFTYENDSERLLKILEKVRSVAPIISKVAEVCEPYKENEILKEEGTILTRIYNEAIKITDTKVALVFYSLLKSCCEVYFRFLQKWIFEGICDDIYGEFMIKTRPQYLRNRSHKFWTRSFSICHDTVPGFLKNLANSILQCGKTVRLLRICDSKNPVCHTCVTEQPDILVCLNAMAIQEQSSRCREYEAKGKSALGSVLSMSTAISEEKRSMKEMSDVVHIQRDLLIKHREKGQQKTQMKSPEEKKEKIESSNEKKEEKKSSNERKTTSPNEKKELSKKIEQDFMIKEREKSQDRKNILNYYENLANEINQRCMRSQWRARRMKLFDERVDALHTANRDSRDQLRRIDLGNPSSLEDENKNYETSLRTFICIETTESSLTKKTNDNETFSEVAGNKNATNRQLNEILSTVRTSRIERPTFLNVTKIDNTEEDIDGISSLNCNMTPNNNELDIHQLDPTRNANELKSIRDIRCSNQDLETPMSCTTDNFTASSAQSSPVSQTYNLESSVEPSSSYSQPISKSSLTIKRDSTFSDLFELAHDERGGSSSSSSSSTVQLTVEDVEVIDHISLQAYLEKSIRIPLFVQSRLVNNAVIKYFLNENKLLLHLHSLRSYFFLLNGEFAKCLTDSLYARLYEISVPIELFNSATLTNLLERALVNSLNNVYVNSELVSLSATETPNQLHTSDPNALDCLSLNYKITWPLNIILDETVMEQYGKVFKFLITSGRVSWVLQEDFNIMKREREAIKSEQYHKLQLYRHSMTQFMNALHNYLTCSVLHASWTEFEKDLEHSLTVDQIYMSHINYVKRILSRCMLNTRGEKIRVCLNSIFKVILKFHNRIRAQGWVNKSSGYVHPNFNKLEQMYKAFCELRAYMAHVALKLATTGYQPHLMHFLNALNINHLYDLTVKTSRTNSTNGPKKD